LPVLVERNAERFKVSGNGKSGLSACLFQKNSASPSNALLTSNRSTIKLAA